MAPADRALLFLFFSLISASPILCSVVAKDKDIGEMDILNWRGWGRRALMGFKESQNGGNITYDCSPSGPCVPCAYSEKNDKNYRCSETGYRIPLKCVEAESHSVEADNSKKAPKGRSTLEKTLTGVEIEADVHPAKELDSSAEKRSLIDDSTTETNGRQPYITYRSCIPAVNDEKLSVFGFEGFMLCLLLSSGSAIYFRRKKANAVPSGHVRVPNDSRF